MCEVKKSTKKGNSYWNNNGAYTKEMEKLWEELVPSSGEADTVNGEMLRSFSRLNYDYFNNGNCNVIEALYETCPDCGGDGYEYETCYECNGSGTIESEDEDIDGESCSNCSGQGETTSNCAYCDGECRIHDGNEINEYYRNCIDFIRERLDNEGKKIVDELEKFIIKNEDCLNDEDYDIYNRVGDCVGHYITTTENVKREIKEAS